MKKTWTTLFLLPALLAGSLSIGAKDAAAASTGTIVSSVSFRTSPNVDSSRIRYLKTGEHVQIIDEVNSYWYKVKDNNGKTGYISTNDKYVKVSGTVSSPPANTAAGTGTIVSSVSFRTSPNTGSSRIRYLKTGERVQIIDEVNPYWYKVKDSSGKTGYISTNDKYVKVSGTVSTPPANTSSNVSKVIAAAKKYMGTPYEFGSDRSNTRTFDCSDFVRQAFKDALGITLPSDSRQQGTYVKSKGNVKTSWTNLKPGDLMFFMEYRGTSKSLYSGVNKSTQRITHVGIYLGDGKMINTYSNASGGVRIDSIDNKHWEYRFLFGGSAL